MRKGIVALGLVLLMASAASAQRYSVYGTARFINGTTDVVYEKNGASFNFTDAGLGKNKVFTELFFSVPITPRLNLSYDGLIRGTQSGNIFITGEMAVDSIVFGKKASTSVAANTGTAIDVELTTQSNAVQLELPYIMPFTRPLIRLETFETNLKVVGNVGTGKGGSTEANKKFRATDFGIGIAAAQHYPRSAVYGSATYLTGSNSYGWDADIGMSYFLSNLSGVIGGGYRHKSLKIDELSFKLGGPYIEISFWF